MTAVQVFLIVAALTTAIDQVTKGRALSKLRARDRLTLGRFISVAITHTPGVGMGAIRSIRLAAGIWGLALAVSLAAAAVAPVGSNGWVVGLGIALGGGSGNLIDLFRRHAVVDLINVGRWPPFNLADVAIVLGVGIASIGRWAGP